MHARRVERVFAARNAQKAGALLERLRPQARHILERLARAERTVAVAVQHDILRQTGADAGNARQQRRRGGVDVDADRVHAVLDHSIERPRQLMFAQIMLILSDADRFRIDLDEFGERILQPAGDGHRAAQGDIEIRQFLRRISRRGINRGAGLRYDDLRHLQLGQQLDQFGGEPVGLTRCRTVADRNQFNLMLFGELAENCEGLVPLPLRLVRIDH